MILILIRLELSKVLYRELSTVLLFKPGSDQKIASHVSPTAKKSVFLIHLSSRFIEFQFFPILFKHKVSCVLNR